MNLPNAEDVFSQCYDKNNPNLHEIIYKAMHEYARRVLDVAEEECSKRIIGGHSVQAPSMIEVGKAILRLKEMLK